MQIKITLRLHLTPVRIAKTKTKVTVHAREDREQGEHFSIAGGSINLHSHFGNLFGSFSENGNQSTIKPRYTTHGHIPKEHSIIPQVYLLNYGHNSFIYNSQNLETA